MSLIDFLKELNDEVSTVNASDFNIEIIETQYVPAFDDPNITYDNLDTNRKKCKLLESCVLYVDIRDSAKISAANKGEALAKMYSSFVRSMIACARYYGGHVRNIIGDRVMVVFDRDECFTNAVATAVLMNTVCSRLLNKHIIGIDFRAGIGIDYGKMLITKAGAIRRGNEKEFYRSLVWLGQPANVASRLTDLANKKDSVYVPGVSQLLHYPLTNNWSWVDTTYEDFVSNLTPTHSRNLMHKDTYFNFFITKQLGPFDYHHCPILMTKAVYEGYKEAHPNCNTVQKNWWSPQNLTVRDYSGEIFGGDVYFTDVDNI